MKLLKQKASNQDLSASDCKSSRIQCWTSWARWRLARQTSSLVSWKKPRISPGWLKRPKNKRQARLIKSLLWVTSESIMGISWSQRRRDWVKLQQVNQHPAKMPMTKSWWITAPLPSRNKSQTPTKCKIKQEKSMKKYDPVLWFLRARRCPKDSLFLVKHR